MARIHPEDYRFCPRCAGELEPRRLRPQEPLRPWCPRCGFVVYLDPKVVVVALIPLAGGLVLVRQLQGPRAGLWVLPGGFVDLGETPEQALQREVQEETGLLVEVDHLFQVYSHGEGQAIILAYLAEAYGGQLTGGLEQHEARRFSPETIPWGALAFSTTRRILEDYLTHHSPTSLPLATGMVGGLRRR